MEQSPLILNDSEVGFKPIIEGVKELEFILLLILGFIGRNDWESCWT